MAKGVAAERPKRVRLTASYVRRWAMDWFKGDGYCPHCHKEVCADIYDSGGDGSHLYQKFRCDSCREAWKVEYTETSVCVLKNGEPVGDYVDRPVDVSPEVKRLTSLMEELLGYEAAQFDGPANVDLHVSGADLIDYFTKWRAKAREALAALEDA